MIMKKILLLAMILMAPLFMVAQDDEIDELPFDNEPLRDEGRAYFVLAGGMTFDWLMVNEDNLNSFDDCDCLELSGPIQLIGGQGVTGIPWVKNLRVGVFGYGGSIESEIEDYPTVTEDMETIMSGIQRSLTASMFGFSLHYGYVPFEHFAILGGVNAGWGDITHEQYVGGEYNDKMVFAEGGYGLNRYEKNFFFAMPNIQFEYALANFIILRADASYNLTFAQDEKWTFNTLGSSTQNPDLDLSGLKVGFGVMIGLVNF